MKRNACVMLLGISLLPLTLASDEAALFDSLYKLFIEEREGSYAAMAEQPDFLDRISAALPPGDKHRSIQRDVVACFLNIGDDLSRQRQLGEAGYSRARNESMFREAALFQICRADAVEFLEGSVHALPLLQEAVQLAERAGDSYIAAVAKLWLGTVLGLLDSSGEALATLLMAKAEFEALGRPDRARSLDIDIGILYRRIGRLDRAEQILRGLLDEFDNDDSASLDDQLAVTIQLSYILNDLNRWEESLDLAAEARRRLGDRELPMWQSTVSAAPAIALNAMGRYHEALDSLDQALMVQANILGHQVDDLQLRRAESLLGLGQTEAALGLVDRLSESPNIMESPSLSVAWNLVRAQALADATRYDEAYEQLLEVRRLERSLQQRNNAEQLIALQATFEVRDRTRLLDQAETEAVLKQAEISALQKAQFWQRLALIVMAILLLTMLLWGSRQRGQRRRMWDLARRDSLTGLANRRAFLETAELELSRMQHGQAGPVLLAIDLDHFKQVNDRYGHPAGDQVLITVANVLRASARADDLISRLGGEEFSLMLPRATNKEAMTVAKRLLRTLEETHFGDIAPDLRLTCSIGIASASEAKSMSLSELMVRADRRLYAAKAAGRNQVIAEENTALLGAHTP
ncbi:MAG: GGDEF domain-containing protein [Wenzhouxiangella sp.]|nr:GGDEF domain-containing protein [Wenzhouxiangella sp.]